MKNTKVGIITFHNAHNYGAVLQAYGLHRKLELLGIEAQFILDAENRVGSKYPLYPRYSHGKTIQYLRCWGGLLLDFKRIKRRHLGFQKFISNNLPSHDLKYGSSQFNCVILGSDQIWNFDITNGMHDFYFGQGEGINTKFIFSYAASMGKEMVDENFTQEFKSKLSKLSSIGVREDSLGKKIKDTFNLNYQVNLDPTLLLEKLEWDKIATHKLCDEAYILIYEVVKHKNTLQVADFLAKKLGYTVKIISAEVNRRVDSNIITTASPEDYLSLFKNAKFAVTSSFHGTVFSIINEIPFFTLKFNNGIDLRSAGLLKTLGLSDRHINDIKEIADDEFDIDYKEPNIKLNELRKASESYLKNNLLNLQ